MLKDRYRSSAEFLTSARTHQGTAGIDWAPTAIWRRTHQVSFSETPRQTQLCILAMRTTVTPPISANRFTSAREWA